MSTTVKRTKIYRLLPKFRKEEGRAFRREVKIPAIDTIFEKAGDGGYVEKLIAYERSRPLHVEKWGKDIDEVRKNPPPKITWSSGYDLYLDPMRYSGMVKYMDNCNFNVSNPNRDKSVTAYFEEVDRNAQAETNIGNEEHAIVAKHAAIKGDIDKLREVMPLLGFSKKNPHGELWTEAEIRDMAMVYINQSSTAADTFNDVWNDPTITYRININMALSLGIIVVDENSAEVKWGHNNNPVTSGRIPVGIGVIDHLVAYVNKGGKGKTFYDEMNARIIGGEDADKISQKFSGALNDAVERMTPKELFDKAEDLNIIVRNTPYYDLFGFEGSKGRLAKGKNEVIEMIHNGVEVNGVNVAELIKNNIKKGML